MVFHHLAVFGKSVDLRIPGICLRCKECDAIFTWTYSFVEPKKRYTKAYVALLGRQSYGTTVAHTSNEHQVPYSTMERIFKQDLGEESPNLYRISLFLNMIM